MKFRYFTVPPSCPTFTASMKYIFLPFSLLWFIAGTVVSLAQTTATWSHDEERLAYGADDFTFSGPLYIPEHQGADRHPFYLESEWQTGQIYLRDQVSPVVRLKYDLVSQQIVIWHAPEGKSPAQLALSAHLVDSFLIGETMFIHHLNVAEPLEEAAYAEPIYKGNFQVYRSIRKQFIPTYNAAHPKGFFGEQETRYWLYKPEKDQWTSFSSSSALLTSLTKDNRELRKVIRKTRRQEGIPRKEPGSAQLSILLNICDE